MTWTQFVLVVLCTGMGLKVVTVVMGCTCAMCSLSGRKTTLHLHTQCQHRQHIHKVASAWDLTTAPCIVTHSAPAVLLQVVWLYTHKSSCWARVCTL